VLTYATSTAFGRWIRSLEHLLIQTCQIFHVTFAVMERSLRLLPQTGIFDRARSRSLLERRQ
jgi:hypothetical protein